MKRMLCVGVMALGVVGTTACEDALTPSPLTQIQFVNAIANSSRLQLQLNGVSIDSAVTFRSFVRCHVVDPGTYVATIRVPGDTALMSLGSVQFDTAAKYTIVATGTMAAPNYAVLPEVYPTPQRGRIKIRPFNAMPTYGAVDMYVTPDGADLGAANATNVAFNTAYDFVDAPAQRSEVQYTRHGSLNVVAFDGPVDLPEETARTVIIADSPGGGTPPRTFVVPSCF